MAQPQQLEFVAVGVDNAVRLTDSGVVDADQVESLPKLGAHEVRVFRRALQYAPAKGKQALPVIQVMELMMRLPRALRFVIARDVAKAPVVNVKVQGYIRVQGKGRWERVEPPPKTTLVELLGSWVRGSEEDEVLLEVAAAADELRVIVDQIPAERSGAETAAAALPQEIDGSAARRTELAKAWLNSAGVAELLGRGTARDLASGSPEQEKKLENPAQAAAVLRKAKRLLGVWVPAERGYRHPTCQFDRGALLPVIEALLKILPPGNGTGWSQAEWLYSPHALLDKRRPADVLATDPDRVLAAAQREYGEETHAGW
ncbi:hypothetical protein [Ahniella affigens]|uniref:hypothetical protein n=1 Tax=Ahniella affigens TaxID=2021234 RepID=UPI0011B241A8|nr:hypothetical protein [Ahniella affigens]